MSPSHENLVLRATKWLRNTRHCPVVLAENVCFSYPAIPDAIGWTPKGWLRCKPSVMCDGDGFQLEPERHRFAYFLTDAGREALARVKP